MARLRPGPAPHIEHGMPRLDRSRCQHQSGQIPRGLGQRFGARFEDPVVQLVAEKEVPRVRDAVVVARGVVRRFGHDEEASIPWISREQLGSGTIVGTMPSNWRKIPWYVRYRTGARVMSALRRVSIQATHLHARVEFQGPV